MKPASRGRTHDHRPFKSAKVQLTAQGVITTRLARPGTVVLEPEVLDAIRAVIGKGPVINGEAASGASAALEDNL